MHACMQKKKSKERQNGLVNQKAFIAEEGRELSLESID